MLFNEDSTKKSLHQEKSAQGCHWKISNKSDTGKGRKDKRGEKKLNTPGRERKQSRESSLLPQTMFQCFTPYLSDPRPWSWKWWYMEILKKYEDKGFWKSKIYFQVLDFQRPFFLKRGSRLSFHFSLAFPFLNKKASFSPLPNQS